MLETKDLILRQGTANDGHDLYRNLWSRAEVFRYMFNKPSPNEAAGLSRTAAYAEMHKEVSTEFFVCEKASNQVIGIAGIKELNPGHWTITDIAIGPDFQGKGFGKQVVKVLTALAFDSHGATTIAYDCFRQNTASKQLALSCGFIYSHSEPAELQKNGENVTLDYYIRNK
ncbi:MAG: GNAT family N-acetyltransferase [Clostridia bacterium]|nr:GNAT family N-acetyltransferase [Clostridia bacterium]